MTNVDRVVHEVLGRLTSGLIHEINNPLGVVLGFASEARSAGPGSPQLTSDLDMIAHEAKRLAELLSHWRAIVSLDAASATTDLRVACRAVWRVFAYHTRGTLTLAIDGDAPTGGGKKPSGKVSRGNTQPNWSTALGAVDQLRLWLCVQAAMLELAQSAKKDATLRVPAPRDHALAVAIESRDGEQSMPTATDFVADCLDAATALLKPLGGKAMLEGRVLKLCGLGT